MPIPKPKPGEAVKDFMSRCMADSVMLNDYKDPKQRMAICVKQEPTASKELFVEKDDKQRLITAPVLIPDTPDCEFHKGEDPLSASKIESMAYAYMKHRHVDEVHNFAQTQKDVGVPVASWILDKDQVYKNINGKDVELPKGTWMATVKVEDDKTWHGVESGNYKGFSVWALSKDSAERIQSAMKGKVLIKDLTDPVGFAISIVPKPCVHDAIFCSIKEAEGAEKAGRTISNRTFAALRTAYDNLGKLLTTAEGERTAKKDDKDEGDVIKMEMTKEEFKEMIEGIIDAKMPKQEPEAKKEEPKEDTELKDTKEALKTAEDKIKDLEKRLGEPKEGNALKGQDDLKETKKVKSVYEETGRDAMGRKIDK